MKPGMTASVRVRTATATGVLRAPATALRFTPPGEKPCEAACVWTLSGSALKRSDVTPGVSDGEIVEVHGDGIGAGLNVVVELTPEGRRAYGIGH